MTAVALGLTVSRPSNLTSIRFINDRSGMPIYQGQYNLKE
jgi:hypothetical protein